MGGYAPAAPLLAIPPPWGEIAWLGVGTAVTIGGIWAVSKVASDSKTDAPAVAKPAEAQDCKKRKYSIFVRAQGADLGSDTKATLTAGTLEQETPFVVAQGIALSAATQALLSKKQLGARVMVFGQLERFLSKLPPAGWLGTKDFVVPGVQGGIRADTGSFGPSTNYLA